MFVGNKTRSAFGNFEIIGQFAVRIDMNNLAVELQHQRTMANEGYFQIPCRCLYNILFEGYRSISKAGTEYAQTMNTTQLSS